MILSWLVAVNITTWNREQIKCDTTFQIVMGWSSLTELYPRIWVDFKLLRSDLIDYTDNYQHYLILRVCPANSLLKLFQFKGESFIRWSCEREKKSGNRNRNSTNHETLQRSIIIQIIFRAKDTRISQLWEWRAHSIFFIECSRWYQITLATKNASKLMCELCFETVCPHHCWLRMWFDHVCYSAPPSWFMTLSPIF